MVRASYHHGDLPEALLVAADALIREKGAAGFSLREAARRIGVDPAACYRHFRDKEAVLQALARRGFTRLAARMSDALRESAVACGAESASKGAAASARGSARAAMGVLAHSYVAFALEEPSAFRAMFGETGVDARDALLRGAYPEGEGPYDLLQTQVRAWAEQSVRAIDVDEVSVTLWAGVHGLACLLIEGALRPRDEAERLRSIDLMFQSILSGFEHGSW